MRTIIRKQPNKVSLKIMRVVKKDLETLTSDEFYDMQERIKEIKDKLRRAEMKSKYGHDNLRPHHFRMDMNTSIDTKGLRRTV